MKQIIRFYQLFKYVWNIDIYLIYFKSGVAQLLIWFVRWLVDLFKNFRLIAWVYNISVPNHQAQSNQASYQKKLSGQIKFEPIKWCMAYNILALVNGWLWKGWRKLPIHSTKFPSINGCLKS